MFVRGRTEKGREKSRSKSRLRKNVECHYFHKFGHYKKDCFKLKEKEDVRRKSQDEKSSVVSVAEEASTSHKVLSVTVLLMPVHEMSRFLIQVVLITYVLTGTGL